MSDEEIGIKGLHRWTMMVRSKLRSALPLRLRPETYLTCPADLVCQTLGESPLNVQIIMDHVADETSWRTAALPVQTLSPLSDHRCSFLFEFVNIFP